MSSRTIRKARCRRSAPAAPQACRIPVSHPFIVPSSLAEAYHSLPTRHGILSAGETGAEKTEDPRTFNIQYLSPESPGIVLVSPSSGFVVGGCPRDCNATSRRRCRRRTMAVCEERFEKGGDTGGRGCGTWPRTENLLRAIQYLRGWLRSRIWKRGRLLIPAAPSFIAFALDAAAP